MNSRNHLRSFLFAVTTMGISLLLLPTAFAADPPKPTEPKSVMQAKDHDGQQEPCKQYRWVHVGHPEKGYNRRVCVDKKAEPLPVAERMDHETKCKKYVREHHGHPDPGKGVDVVKVVYVECPQKR